MINNVIKWLVHISKYIHARNEFPLQPPKLAQQATKETPSTLVLFTAKWLLSKAAVFLDLWLHLTKFVELKHLSVNETVFIIYHLKGYLFAGKCRPKY